MRGVACDDGANDASELQEHINQGTVEQQSEAATEQPNKCEGARQFNARANKSTNPGVSIV